MTAKLRLSSAHYETLAEFRYTLRKFLRFSEQAAHAAGITPQQHQAMLAIKGFPGRTPITIGELAERLQILPHSAVGLVDRLVADGYLRRRHVRKDKRQVCLNLTARGQAILGRLSSSHFDQLRRLQPGINRLLKSFRTAPN
jgi:DNA-binding MarR family transcriptional regulator